MKTEILYGFHPVYEALRAGRRTFHEIYISKQPHAKRIERIRSAADRKNILLKETSPAKMQAIGGLISHQGVMAKVTAYPLADTADLLGTVLSGTRSPFFLLLDQIVDPHNLGAIIRTGLCAGIDGVIIENTSAEWTLILIEDQPVAPPVNHRRDPSCGRRGADEHLLGGRSHRHRRVLRLQHPRCHRRQDH